MKTEVKVTGCDNWGCCCAKCPAMPRLQNSPLKNCLRCKDYKCPEKSRRPCTIDDIEVWRVKELENTYHKRVTKVLESKPESKPNNLEFGW